MTTDINTGKKLKLIETNDINKVPFEEGQYIIVDNGMIYYDPTTGISIEDRICLTPKREVDVYERTDNFNDEYYLSLQTKPINGDLVIIKDLIANTNNYMYTIYMYNDNEEDTNLSEWCKLTGTYNAKDIYLDKDISITIPIEGLQNNIIESAGKSVEDTLMAIFSPDLNPIITQPSVNLSFPKSGYYEIGSTVIPTYSMELNPGEYEYGPNTDVSATSYIAVSSDNITKTTKSGNFSEIIVDEFTDFCMSASIVHTSGAIPLTIKGNEYLDGMIKDGSVSIESAHIIGYMNGLYYGCSEDIKTNDNITSTFIRDLNKSGKAYEANTTKLLVPVGTKSIIIACPVNEIGISNIYNFTANCDMTQAFGEPHVISVAGNNSAPEYARDYNVWIYSPAEPYEIATELSITTL